MKIYTVVERDHYDNYKRAETTVEVKKAFKTQAKAITYAMQQNQIWLKKYRNEEETDYNIPSLVAGNLSVPNDLETAKPLSKRGANIEYAMEIDGMEKSCHGFLRKN
ncbi:hypothetical protein HDU79_009319 [Rhizoclosmatium sp. JEL0117]|nr:hypothetical protein HDU79_009319 [Rhizoclosmatium sp. JEL0117]